MEETACYFLQETASTDANLSVSMRNAGGLLHIQQLCVARGIAVIGCCKSA